VTPLPGRLGGGEIVAWRIDEARHAATWNSGEGARLVGGRWNSVGVRAVYCAIDPATAIVEVAVHKGFDTLDTKPHVLTSLQVSPAAPLHIVGPGDVPNPNWLRPGTVTTGQQQFGDALLRQHPFVLIPSVVSSHSWNLIFDSTVAAGHYTLLGQERLAIDPRLATRS
jgi:RES domain-containing protein